jgi:hypothetical protein
MINSRGMGKLERVALCILVWAAKLVNSKGYLTLPDFRIQCPIHMLA